MALRRTALRSDSQFSLRSSHFKTVCVLLLTFASAQASALEAATLTWQPAKLLNGSPVFFEVTAPANAKSVSAQWLGHEVVFFHPPGGQAWNALAGVPLETKPGKYELVVTQLVAGGRSKVLKRSVRVFKATYPKISVEVAKKFTEPDPEQLRQISADKELKQRLLSLQSPEREWSGRFHAPVAVGLSGVFGTERVFNGQVLSRHQGLDFAAPAGTPVHAINGGTVILARNLYFEGGCVVLDHGQGLLSLYLHLSEVSVKEGDRADAGQVLGLSGSSGRATGPHLHLAVRWQGVYLNPQTLLNLSLP